MFLRAIHGFTNKKLDIIIENPVTKHLKSLIN